MISLIILNWKRQDNIKNYILPYLEDNNYIDEIIISHGREDTIFEYISKNKNIIHRYDSKLNHSFGLSLRFLSALTCQNKIIMFMDDDEIILNEDIYRCYDTIKNNNNIGIIGKYGRKFYKENNEYVYNFHNVNGVSDIILTKFMLLKKKIIYDFFYNSILVEYLQKNAKPFWNGEDIFISLLARKRYGNKSLHAYRDIKGKKLDEMGVSISRWNGHKNFRQFFYNNCLKIMQLE
jgi:hypothetical protein